MTEQTVELEHIEYDITSNDTFVKFDILGKGTLFLAHNDAMVLAAKLIQAVAAHNPEMQAAIELAMRNLGEPTETH